MRTSCFWTYHFGALWKMEASYWSSLQIWSSWSPCRSQDFLDNTLYKLCMQNNFEIFQNHSVSNLSPMCPTASNSLSDQPSDRQIKRRSTSTFWSASTCTRTRSFRKIFILTYCHGHALRFDWGLQVRTGLMALNYILTAWGACKFGSGQ